MPSPAVFPDAAPIDFRLAAIKDAYNLVDLYRTFFNESDLPSWGLTFDPDRAVATAKQVIHRMSPVILVAVDPVSGRIIGTLSWKLDHEGTVQPYAFLDKFYVRPEWRTQGVGQRLVAIAVEQAKDEGAVLFRAGLSSGIPGADILFQRMGFKAAPGSVLMERKL